MPFFVVEFPSKDVEAVPGCWLRRNKATNEVHCSWPEVLSKRPSKLREAINNSEQPPSESKTYRVDILKQFGMIHNYSLHFDHPIKQIFYYLDTIEAARKYVRDGSQSSSKSMGRGKRLKTRKNYDTYESYTSSDNSELVFEPSVASSPHNQ